MAEYSQDKDSAADASDKGLAPRRQAAPQADSGPDRFEVADLIARSIDFLGHESHVTAGALHGQEGPLTLDDARGRVEAYLTEPVTEEA